MNPESDPDVQLMLALQGGDLAAFDRLFALHYAGAVRFAARFVGSRARAEEVAQDVFLQLFRSRDRYLPRARFKTWLFRMVANACLTDLRRPDHKRRVDDPDAAERLAADPESDASGERALLGREAADKMRLAVESLPPQQRAALLLARAEGLSYEEVAETLSLSVSAVKSLIHRATVTLQDGWHRGEGEE